MSLVTACVAGGMGLSSAATARVCESVQQAEVEDIYPTAEILPDNLLRFYVYFSKPMAREPVLKHVTLRSAASGEVVPGVFYESRYDLWSSDGRRLTLLLDPGRVKSGLDSSVALGRALMVGEDYTLEVGNALSDVHGCGLRLNHSKQFTVERSDTIIPDPDQWNIEAPSAGSNTPVTVKLNGPHDHVSLAYRLLF